MNTVYLVKSYGENTVYYKVGFTRDINRRIQEYKAYNPACKFVSIVNTYNKTKYQLETAIHLEIKECGYDFATYNSIESEWFEVEKDGAMDFVLTMDGLQVFKACKHRRVLMCEA